MSLQMHVQSLNQKHAKIDATISREEIRPHPDTMRLMQLKRQKLRLKEEMQKLKVTH
ncbi:MAG: YdcH family protein [Kordiimonadaceae bacterium]|nr:YdcH family protein [Kordiimonadaceae bacterium]